MRMDVSYIDRDIARWKGLLKKAGSDDNEIRSQLARFLPYADSTKLPSAK